MFIMGYRNIVGWILVFRGYWIWFNYGELGFGIDKYLDSGYSLGIPLSNTMQLYNSCILSIYKFIYFLIYS